MYNGDLYAAGKFRYANGYVGGFRVNNIARWDGSRWHPMSSGLNDVVLALTVYNGDLVAGGLFTEAGGLPADYVARWNGWRWEAMFGLNGNPFSFATYNGDLIGAGSFNRASGLPAPYIARWNGTQWSPLGNREVDVATDLVVYRDTLIANAYYTIDGFEWILVSQWNGVDWTPLGGEQAAYLGPDVWTFALYNEHLIAGGQFNGRLGGPNLNNIARWDGTTWLPLGSGLAHDELDGAARDLVVHDGSLCVGGRFNVAGGKPSWYIARWDDVITPVAVQDFAAVADPEGVRLSWRLSSPAGSGLAAIAVQRADDSLELFGTIGYVSLAQGQAMSFFDPDVEPGRRYTYRLALLATDGAQTYSGPIVLFAPRSTQQTVLEPPRETGSGEPIPIRFTLAARTGPILLDLYDIRGRLVRSLERSALPPGSHVRLWDCVDQEGLRVPRGVYLVRLQASGATRSQRLVVLHQ